MPTNNCLSVVLPCYNEAATVGEGVRREAIQNIDLKEDRFGMEPSPLGDRITGLAR